VNPSSRPCLDKRRATGGACSVYTQRRIHYLYFGPIKPICTNDVESAHVFICPTIERDNVRKQRKTNDEDENKYLG